MKISPRQAPPGSCSLDHTYARPGCRKIRVGRIGTGQMKNSLANKGIRTSTYDGRVADYSGFRDTQRTGGSVVSTQSEGRRAAPDRPTEATGASAGTLLKRIATYSPGTVVPAVLTMVTSLVFTRVFSPEVYGRFSLFLVVVTPLRLVFTTWLTQGMGKFLPPEQTDHGRRQAKEAVFLSTAVVVLAESLFGVLAFAVAALLLPPGWHSFLLPVLLFFVVTSVFETLILLFPVEARAGVYVRYRLLDSVLTLGLRLALVSGLVGMGITLMFWSVVVSNAVLLPLMWLRAGLPSPTRFVHVLRSSGTRRRSLAFLGFGLPMTAWYFSGVLLDVGDRYVISFVDGPGPVGIYDASYRLIAGVATLMVVPIGITLHPYLMKLSGAADDARVGRVLGSVVENVFLVGLLTTGLVLLVHRDVARVLLGAQFREGSVIMPLVVAGVFVFNIGMFAHKPFEISGRTRPMVAMAFVAAAANLALCFVLVPLVGYVGAAWATLLAYATYTVGIGLRSRRVIAWRIDVRRTARRSAALLAGTAAILALRAGWQGLPYGWDLLLTALCAGTFAGVALLVLLRGSRPAPSTEGDDPC